MQALLAGRLSEYASPVVREYTLPSRRRAGSGPRETAAGRGVPNRQ